MLSQVPVGEPMGLERRQMAMEASTAWTRGSRKCSLGHTLAVYDGGPSDMAADGVADAGVVADRLGVK